MRARFTTAVFLFAFTFLGSTRVNACSFDTDCEVGSRCAKAPGALYGLCVGGLFPGNNNDRTPVYDPLDLDGTVGNTCSFDVDCGVSNRCLKSSSSIDGVCVRRR
jgi:hypothetical protein